MDMRALLKKNLDTWGTYRRTKWLSAHSLTRLVENSRPDQRIQLRRKSTPRDVAIFPESLEWRETR